MGGRLIEYRVRPKTRYIITRFERSKDGTEKSEPKEGQFKSEEKALATAQALARDERERLGWEIGDPRMVFPTTAELEPHEKAP